MKSKKNAHTYLLNIKENEIEIWRKFDSKVRLKGSNIRETLLQLIREFITEKNR